MEMVTCISNRPVRFVDWCQYVSQVWEAFSLLFVDRDFVVSE